MGLLSRIPRQFRSKLGLRTTVQKVLDEVRLYLAGQVDWLR